MTELNLKPRPWSRNTHLQTFFASSRLRTIGRNGMLSASREVIVPAGNGVRLLGYYSQKPAARGTVALIHGWEGSADSAYILSAGRYLFGQGFSVFRLNLRDHGASHHLNEGLFHGALIDETAGAVGEIAKMEPEKPFYLAGFSLGANFSLRIALRQSKDPIANLRHVVAVSPALDPYKATVSIDTGFAFYRRYFLNKWKRSLQRKQALFPERYRFDEVLRMDTCLAMTEGVMQYYPEFANYRDYFSRYTLLGDAFRDLQIPVTIIASEDDPVIPVADFLGLSPNPNLTISLQKYGGHCGFFTAIPFDCWQERRMAAIFMGGSVNSPS
jgi:predicted alpha/beta-fold hydrolase